MARIFVDKILDHILSLIETNLKTSLNLKGIYRGGLAWLPPSAVSGMVNGIWVEPSENTDIQEVQLPKALLFTYRFRLVFVRLIDMTSNVLNVRMKDAESIVDMIYDNFDLKTLSLTGGQGLWMLPRTIEWMPQEDQYVSAISADLTATAFRIEVSVRTKI